MQKESENFYAFKKHMKLELVLISLQKLQRCGLYLRKIYKYYICIGIINLHCMHIRKSSKIV